MQSGTPPTTPAVPAAPPKPAHRRVAVAATVAAAAEWYDYLIFGIAAAIVFGPHFFPSGSSVAGVLAAFATFAVGFVARPVGGVLAGQFGDRYGRKPVLVASLATMGAATVLIGLLPTYATAGVWAPVGLVALRIVQGLAVGAQWGGAMLLATEYAPPGRRGVYGGLVQLGVPLGLVLANGSFLLASAVAPGDGFDRWGWRLPFLLGAGVIGIAVLIHRQVDDTPEFRRVAQRLAESQRGRRRAERGGARGPAAASPGRSRRDPSPLAQILRHHRRTVLLATGAFTVVSATFYVLITGTLDYATRSLGMGRSAVLAITLVVSVCQFVTLPAFAALSDRYGRLRVYAVGAVAVGVWSVPMFLLIDTGSVAAVLVALLVGCVALSLMYGPQAALFTELFAAEVRYTGASLGYQLGSLVGGGIAPFVMVALIEATGTSLAVAGYLVVLCLAALLSLRAIARRPVHGGPADPATAAGRAGAAGRSGSGRSGAAGPGGADGSDVEGMGVWPPAGRAGTGRGRERGIVVEDGPDPLLQQR